MSSAAASPPAQASVGMTADPLDSRVVEAYWVGNDLLDNVRISAYGAFLDERFRGPAGRGWDSIAQAIPAAAVPHHSFHVFLVYPWTGLLREGHADPSLRILDGCRISWGQVIEAGPGAGTVLVMRRPLRWGGRGIGYGPAVPHEVATGFVTGLLPGDWVSLHWDRVCDRLSQSQLLALRRFTGRHLCASPRRQ